MAARFRLLDLDEECIKTVLKCFDGFDLISFSLCSKKRLTNVCSLKLHKKELRIACGTVFYAQLVFKRHLMRLYFCEDGYDRRLDEWDDRSRRLQVDYIEGCYPYENLYRQDPYQEPTIRRWRKANFQGNDWLRHLMDVFNCVKISSMHVQESKFDIDSVVDIVQNLNIVSFTTFPNVTKQHTLSWLQAQPCLENLIVDSLTFDDPSEFSIFLRNQKSLIVQGLPIKAVNRFIKLWKKVANPRLSYLCVNFYAYPARAVVLHENEILSGVQYQRIPQGTVRLFEMPGKSIKIDGGFDVAGKTGRKVTVTLHNQAGFSVFNMYIWL